MKHFKISMFAVIAIVMGIAASAFTTSKADNPDKGKVLTNWYQFMGDPTILSEVQDYTKYSYEGGTACSGSDLVCAVKTTGAITAHHQPDAFSNDLKARLSEVFNQTSTYSDISQEP